MLKFKKKLQLSSFNVSSSSFNGRAIRGSKFRDDLEKGLTFILDVVPVRVKQRLKLRHHQVHPGLKLW